MSDGNGTNAEAKVVVPIAYHPGTPFDQMIATLVANAHGARRVIAPGEQVSYSEVVITFKCVDGHTHEVRQVFTPQPRLLLQVIEPARPLLKLVTDANGGA